MSSEMPSGAMVKLLVKGFNVMERRLLEGTVKLSQRRAPRIELVADVDAPSADVVMIDANDPASLQWTATQPWLAAKPVIWAGGKAARPGHTLIDRHVQWPILPVLLYRAIEEHGTNAAQASASASAPAHAGANARRVLVVDDSLAVRNYLRSLLERQGIEVTEASSAEAGIEASQGGAFQCVLMDVLMPGIDGFEACRRIKARARSGEKLPVVMLTSKSSPFDRVRGKMAGCDTYLTKPVDPAQLYEVLARHIPGLAIAKPAPTAWTSPMQTAAG